MNSKSLYALVVMLAFTLFTTAGTAATLYGVDSATDSLALIDPVTGATTVIGTGLDPLQTALDNRYATPVGLAIRPSDQRIFVANNSKIIGGVPSSTGDLVTVDPVTGVATLVGTHGEFASSLAFSPAGQLYGLEFDLFALNDNTGAATLVAPITTATGQRIRVFGADFDAGGVLYVAATDPNFPFAHNSLYTVNTTTGVASFIGALAFAGAPGSIAFDPSGQLIGTDIVGDLFDIDKASGALSNARTLSPLAGDQGLGFVSAVPEPSSFTLLGLGCAVVLAGRRAFRR